MRSGWSWIGWGIVLGLMGSPVWGAEPDPEAVRRLKEKYERDSPEEAAKKAPAPKPQPKPARPKPEPKPQPRSRPQRWITTMKPGKRRRNAERRRVSRRIWRNNPQGRYARMARARLEAASEAPPPAPVEWRPTGHDPVVRRWCGSRRGVSRWVVRGQKRGEKRTNDNTGCVSSGFEIGQDEVTVGEFKRFVNATGLSHRCGEERGWQGRLFCLECY